MLLAIHVAGTPDERSRAPEPPTGPTSSGEPRALQPLGGRAASSIFAEDKPPWAASSNLFPNPKDAAVWNTPVELVKKRAAEAIDDPPPPTGAACDATLADSERLLLTAFASTFHGSTALHQVLQSGPEVASLCMGRSWQCEPDLTGAKHAKRCDACLANYTAGGAGAKPCDAVPCISCAEELDDCDARNASAVVRANLELFEPYWEAQPGRRVLMAKWAPLNSGQCGLYLPNESDDKLRNLTQESWAPGDALFSGFGAAALTPNLRAAGVSRLRWAVVVLIRPWCMWSISSNAVEARATRGAQAWAESELEKMELQVGMHKALRDQNVPILINGCAPRAPHAASSPPPLAHRSHHRAAAASSLDRAPHTYAFSRAPPRRDAQTRRCCGPRSASCSACRPSRRASAASTSTGSRSSTRTSGRKTS